MSSSKNSAEDSGTSQKLHQLGKSVSYDCFLRASSCIELADIRKLDSLLNQCESISCDNLLLCDEIYNYELCTTTKKYLSTSALNRILPKNSIRRRAHKKALGICENDTKIIKLIDDKRTAACDGIGSEKNINNNIINNNDDDDDPTDVELTESYVVNTTELLMTQSCTNLMHEQVPTETSSCCDKTIQTSFSDLNGSQSSILGDITCKYLHHDDGAAKTTTTICLNSSHHRRQLPHKVKPKRCQCRKSDNEKAPSSHNVICETSLTTPPSRPAHLQSKIKAELRPHAIAHSNTPPRQKSLLQPSKCNRFTRQPATIVYDEDPQCTASNLNQNSAGDSHDNRMLNINETSIEIIPISKQNSNYSHSLSPKGTSNNLHLDAKSDRSETQSQRSLKSKRSKFSPAMFTRKLTSRLNSEDDAGGVKESLLGTRGKSNELKLPEPVETVCFLTL